MNIEEKLAELDAKIEEYNLAIHRAQAFGEILSVVGRYAFYYSAQKFNECAKLWACRDDVLVDIGGGAEFIGYESVCRNYSDDNPLPVGLFRIHTFSTPCVEVAADGKTAKGVWFSPGIDTDPPTPSSNGKGSSKWCWIKYAVDFIFEDGKWYIWHFRSYGIFHCDFYQSWADKEPTPLFRDFDMMANPPQSEDGAHMPPPLEPDRINPRHDWTYASDRRPELDPAPPEPYETWTESC